MMYPANSAEHSPGSDVISLRKRPLSISSMSSASSLTDSRKKRTTETTDSRDTGIPDEDEETEVGERCSFREDSDHAQSQHSVDSGCVDADRQLDVKTEVASLSTSPVVSDHAGVSLGGDKFTSRTPPPSSRSGILQH